MLSLILGLTLTQDTFPDIPRISSPVSLDAARHYTDYGFIEPSAIISNPAGRIFRTRDQAYSPELPVVTVMDRTNSKTFVILQISQLIFGKSASYFEQDNILRIAAKKSLFTFAIGQKANHSHLGFWLGPGYGIQDTEFGFPKDTVRCSALVENEFAVYDLFPTKKSSIIPPPAGPYQTLELVAKVLSPDEDESVEHITNFFCRVTANNFDPFSRDGKRFLSILKSYDTEELNPYTKARINGVRLHFGDYEAEIPFYLSLVELSRNNPGLWNDLDSRAFPFNSLVNTSPVGEKTMLLINRPGRNVALLKLAAQTNNVSLRKMILLNSTKTIDAKIDSTLAQLLDGAMDDEEYADRMLFLLPSWTNHLELDPLVTTLTRTQLIERWRDLFPPPSR